MEASGLSLLEVEPDDEMCIAGPLPLDAKDFCIIDAAGFTSVGFKILLAGAMELVLVAALEALDDPIFQTLRTMDFAVEKNPDLAVFAGAKQCDFQRRTS